MARKSVLVKDAVLVREDIVLMAEELAELVRSEDIYIISELVGEASIWPSR